MTRFQAVKAIVKDIGTNLFYNIFNAIYAVGLAIGIITELALSLIGLGWLIVRYIPLGLDVFIQGESLLGRSQHYFMFGVVGVLFVFLVYLLIAILYIITVEPIKYVVERYRWYRHW